MSKECGLINKMIIEQKLLKSVVKVAIREGLSLCEVCEGRQRAVYLLSYFE